MSRYTIVVASAAAEHFVDIVTHLELQSPAGANLWVAQYERVLESLKDMPRQYPIAREVESIDAGGLRQALVYSHRLLFTIDGSTVTVLYIWHSARRDFPDC